MLVRHIHHGALAIAAQDMHLLALEAAHHHRVVGGNQDLRFALHHRAFTRAQHVFDIVEVTQLPDRVQMRIGLVQQEQAVVFAGNAHQAQHGEHLQLAFRELLELHIATMPLALLHGDAHFFQQIADIGRFGIAKKALRRAHQFAQFFQLVLVGHEQIQQLLLFRLATEINGNLPGFLHRRPSHLPQLVEKAVHHRAAPVPKARVAQRDVLLVELTRGIRLFQHKQRGLDGLDVQIVQQFLEHGIFGQQASQQHQLAVAAPAVKQPAHQVVIVLPQQLFVAVLMGAEQSLDALVLARVIGEHV